MAAQKLALETPSVEWIRTLKPRDTVSSTKEYISSSTAFDSSKMMQFPDSGQ
jgi:hypothetical protein